MDTYKDFIQRLTKIYFNDVYLLLHDNFCPKLKEYIVLLMLVKFEDGAYHTYYGNIKKIVASYTCYYSQSIDKISVEADKYSIDVKKEDLLTLLEETTNIYQINQVEFGKEFLPVTNSMEREMYDEMDIKFNEHMFKLQEMGEKIKRLDKQDRIDAFAQVNLKITIRRASEVFVFCQEYLSMMLFKVTNRIRVSLEEIHLRLNNNLLRIQDEYEEKLNGLLDLLYEKNKEHIHLMCRQARRSSIENAEISRSLDIIKKKLDNTDYLRIKARIEDELAYWKGRIDELQVISNILSGLNAKQDEIIEQEETYNRIQSSEPPGPRFSCWEQTGEMIRKKKQRLQERIPEATQMLITFFSCRGTDRVFYMDNIGPYCVDEFNHQNYFFNYGMDIFHVNCEGEFVDVSENEKYYFNENGRYIIENGEKLYQCAPCTSKYKLNDNKLFEKITDDCGHSNNKNSKCRMDMKDITDVEILPKTDILDIKNSLSPEVVKYLWDSFGHILPDVLQDFGMFKYKNPIHRLAHKILKLRYSKTAKQLRIKSDEARAYSAEVYNGRKIRAENAAKAWNSKLVKRRKPEEFDDAQELAVHEAHLAEQEHILSLNYYYD